MDEDKPEPEPQAAQPDQPASSAPPAPAVPLPPAAAAPAQAAVPPPSRGPGESNPGVGRGSRPEMTQAREPLYRQAGGYRLKLEPQDLAKLRELPGSKEKSDRELGEQFFDGQAARLTGAISDVPAPAEVRVVVDPYSRQAFLAVGRTIRGIVSF
jgi:hypothetical protein